jgi:hypothetical protein
VALSLESHVSFGIKSKLKSTFKYLCGENSEDKRERRIFSSVEMGRVACLAEIVLTDLKSEILTI